MPPRAAKAFAGLGLLASLVCPVAVSAQSDPPPGTKESIFANPGQGGRWIGEFFPYGKPDLEGIHAALGKMLEVYNSGILVLAGLIALWTIVNFIAETAHHGEVGGRRGFSLFGSLRLVFVIGLLVPLGSGYNSAQVIAIKLAESGSGLANSVWRKFVPVDGSYSFSRATFSSGNVDSFMQQALVDESCLAAVGVTAQPGEPQGSVTVQAFYPDPAHPQHEVEGEEIPLTTGTGGTGDGLKAQNALQAGAMLKQSDARWLRVHYNRAANDDFCGSLDIPVPTVPTGTRLAADDQAVYLTSFLAVRPLLANYATRVASQIDAAVKARSGAKTNGGTAPEAAPDAADFAQDVADAAEQGEILPSEGNTASPANPPPAAGISAASPASGKPPTPPGAPPQVEVPQMDLPPRAWDALLDKFERQLRTATDALQATYIGGELKRDYGEGSDPDWISAGSLFFRLMKLSHDDLRLRFGSVSGDLPSPDILPQDMRGDGVLAICPDLRSDVFLPDFHCRPEGKETTLVIKTAYSILHTTEAQRGADVLPAVDAGPGSGRRQNPLSGNLLGLSRLDTVVESLGRTAHRSDTDTRGGKDGGAFESMFDAVNAGNALFLSSSSLFRESALAGQAEGGGTHSLILAAFAGLVLIPAFFLGVFLPLFPALRFYTGIAAWLVTIFEALVALPLVALVQLRGEVGGLAAHGRQGWLMLLQMLLRPTLMIVGLMAAVVVFETLYGMVTWAIWSALLNASGDPGQFGGGIEGMLEVLGYLFFWTFLIYLAANISFNAITAIPDRILLWIGAMGGTTLSGYATGAQAIPPAAGVQLVSGGPGPSGLPPVSAANLVTGSAGQISGPGALQIGRSGGRTGASPAGAPDEAPGAGGMGVAQNRANADHFPRGAEVHIHDVAPGIGAPQPPATSAPRTDSRGNPIGGKENKDFIPPVQGDHRN